MDDCPHGLGDPAWCVACNGKRHLTVSGEAAAIAEEGAAIARLAAKNARRRAAAPGKPVPQGSPDDRLYRRSYGPGDNRRERARGSDGFRTDRR